jgi:hypothetical protein
MFLLCLCWCRHIRHCCLLPSLHRMNLYRRRLPPVTLAEILGPPEPSCSFNPGFVFILCGIIVPRKVDWSQFLGWIQKSWIVWHSVQLHHPRRCCALQFLIRLHCAEPWRPNLSVCLSVLICCQEARLIKLFSES